MGENYDKILRKNANIRGKRWKKGVKEEIFTVFVEKNITLEKEGGAKYQLFR